MIAYAITDPSTLDFTTLQDNLTTISAHANMIVYRDKHTINYAQNAKIFLLYAKNFDKVFLHTDYLLAAKLGADGVHLKSTQFTDIKKAKDLGLFVVVSTHTEEEAKQAELLGADMITLSPIFDTPNKGKPIGLSLLELVVSRLKIPVIALGGILSEEQINACIKSGAKGFASIRYFKYVS